ncbi:MAG: hypothetical protein BroJett025_05250 [Patescibacteria group bacterium]|nr:MAG: hypothetical protein BroJett025_05250 [Patescibacteria group bacterium]
MRVLFYSPYIPDHLGGGEKHFFDVATTVATKHEVFIALSEEFISREKINEITNKYEQFLNYSLKKITFISSKLKTGSIYEKLQETSLYDAVYYVTDGSFFLSMAKKNILHVQIPFTNSLNVWQKIKLASWNVKNTNSQFTKSVIEKSWNTTINFVHYPLVSLDEISPKKNKEKIILNVGRFFRQLHSKRQDVLVQLFKKLVDEYKNETQGWRLVLVGSVEDELYFNQVKDSVGAYPIEIKTTVSRDELVSLYKTASFYWHATGFGVDENSNPEKVEHFGISTIEAMAAGCVPIVIKKGGQKEILGLPLHDLLWETGEQCVEITKDLITNPDTYKKFQEVSLNQVKKFSKQEFEKTLWEMF